MILLLKKVRRCFTLVGLVYKASGIMTVKYDSSYCKYEQSNKLTLDRWCCMIVNASTKLHLIVVFKCTNDNCATICVNPPCYLWNAVECKLQWNNIRLYLGDLSSDLDGENTAFKLIFVWHKSSEIPSMQTNLAKKTHFVVNLKVINSYHD